MINRIAICLFLGIITTVAVAWGCWMNVNPRAGTMIGSLRWAKSDSWSFWVFHQNGATLVQRISQRADWMALESKYVPPRQLPQWSAVRRKPSADELQFTGSIVEDARGWPLLSLYSESRVPPQIMSMPNNTAIVLQQPFEKGSLPNRMIWFGFLTDSAIYAAAWSLLVIAPVLVNRDLRRHRGACAACGYDLRFTPHSTKCPECGASLTVGAAAEL